MSRFWFVLALLLAAGCQLSHQPEDSPLLVAARAGDVATVRRLLARGADPNSPAGFNEWPPLLHSIHKAQLGTTAALIDGGADVNGASPDGTTPLMMAAGYGYTDFVKLLLSRGADPGRRDMKGSSALDYALTGVADIDRFTWFSCQNDTASLLANRGIEAGAASIRWARLKRC